MRITAIALGLVLGGTLPLLAQEAPAPGAPKPPGGEGIKVHGHWTIEVRNRDGSVASRTEFENALTSLGRAVLAELLARRSTVGTWTIGFAGSTANPCASRTAGTVDASGFCVIVQPNAPRLDDAPSYHLLESRNLVVTYDTNAVTVVLSGSYEVPEAGVIDHVASAVGTCGGDCASFQMGTSYVAGFSGTSTPPRSVEQGQIVMLKVVFSFQ